MSHIILWNEVNVPDKFDLEDAIKSIPRDHWFKGVRTFDIPDRGKVKALIFNTPAAEPDAWTTPVIHDLDYPES